MNRHSGRRRRCRGRVEIARMVSDSGQRTHRGWKRKHKDGDVVLAALVLSCWSVPFDRCWSHAS